MAEQLLEVASLKDEQEFLNDGEVHFSICLDDDEHAEGLLGSEVYENSGSYESQPRREVTSLKSTSCRGGPSSARFYFAPRGRSASNVRFKRAEISFDFQDAATVGLNPHDASFDWTHQPEVLHWAPRNFQGPITQLVGQKTAQLDLNVSDPSNISGVHATGATAGAYIKDRYFSIQSMKEGDPGGKVRWILRENELKKDGLPKAEISLGAIVCCTPGRKFISMTKIKAIIRLPFAQLSQTAGIKDDPLSFTYPEERVERHLEPELERFNRLDHLFSNNVSLRVIAGVNNISVDTA
ncbi:hypothetical protein B7463_g747, partial [Scytalidium lignicola]